MYFDSPFSAASPLAKEQHTNVPTTMSTLNITPAERNSTDKYKEKCEKLKRHIQSLLSENQRLKEDLLKYQDEVRSLRKGLNGNMNYCGRNASNNRKKMEWDQSDHCNNKIIRDFCKNKLFPNHKFLGQECREKGWHLETGCVLRRR